MPERGIYTSSNEMSFQSDGQIRKKLALEGQLPPLLETPLPLTKDFTYWSRRMQSRQSEYLDTRNETQHVQFSFPEDTCINFIGDIHAGSPNTDYERLDQEVEVILNTPNSYVVGLGDWIDGFFFNPAQFEQIEQAPEQFMYMRSLVKHIAEHKRLLVAFGGDHDNWAKKSGYDFYSEFAQDMGVHYMYGIGFITAKVGSEEYHISAAHRHNGFSIYNNAHAAMRLGKLVEGSDVAVTAHNHKKGHVRQAVKEFGGGARTVDYVAIGTYKADDDYGKKLGFGRQAPEEMYGSSIILRTDRRVEYYDDILRANEVIGYGEMSKR